MGCKPSFRNEVCAEEFSFLLELVIVERGWDWEGGTWGVGG